MAQPIATVGEYVLTHVDDKFQRWHTTPKNKHKKGENFTEYRDQDGHVAQLSWDGTGAIDGDGGAKVAGDGSWQGGTSFGYNGQTDPFTVLPSPGSGNAFTQAGIGPGDFIQVTNPSTGQSTFTVYGDNGPSDQLGEISSAAAQNIGLNPSPANGGFNDLTATDRLQYEAYPGSAIRDANGKLKKLNKDEIQRYGLWAKVDAQTKISGMKLISGSTSVFVGPKIAPAIMADPMSMHVGNCPIDHGSDSVSIQGAPASRIGDACTCGHQVVSGFDPVLVGGNTTTKGSGQSSDDSPTLFGGMTANQLGAGLNAPNFGGWPR